MSCDQGHVKVLARTLGAAADSLDEVAADDETRAKLWDGLNATQRKALDELVACGKRREREADAAPPPKKARKELSARDRLRIIGAQLRADGASPPASAESWGGLLARLQEVDRITAGDPLLRVQLASTSGFGRPEPLFIDILPGLRNSEGKFFLRLSRNDPVNMVEKGYRDYEVELVQPAQPSAVEKAVAELARDLVEKYSQWRVHRREKRAA
jgi:hypothetical protein